MTHQEHAAQVKPAVPCNANHVAIGGGCYNCLYDLLKPFKTEHLTIAEVLTALRISRATYYRLVRYGQLNPRNVSPRRVLIPRTEVDAILEPVQKVRP